jgi:methionyl-tRNA formyltransferase
MRIAMMGTGLFAEPTFEALLAASKNVVGLVTQPDRHAGNERGSTRQVGKGMKTIAQEAGLPVLQPESVNSPEGIAGLSAWQPELLVVAAYGQILSRDVLAIPSHGGINVHASLLPKYRGAAPIHWAILNGESRTGVTIIRMSLALDAGEMLAQEGIDILPHETSGELEARLAPLGARLALEVIGRMEKGPVSGTKQEAILVTKAPKMTKAHGAIPWEKSAAAICCHVRAMQPWPTAYTFLHHGGGAPVRLILYKVAHRFANPGETGRQGEVLVHENDRTRLEIVAGDGGIVEVLELQPAGKRRMTARDFLQGHTVKPGDRLGPETP